MDGVCRGIRRAQSLRYPKGTPGTCRKPVNRARSKLARRSESRMTFSQQQALITSWKSLRGQASSIMRKILIDLENESPKVKQIFCKAAVLEAFHRDDASRQVTLEDHMKSLVSFFDETIQNISNEDEVAQQMKKIGQHHALLKQSCSFDSEIWEKLGEIAMEVLCSHDAVQKTRDGSKAWRILIAWATDEFRNGFDGQARLSTRNWPSTERLSCNGEEILWQMSSMRLT